MRKTQSGIANFNAHKSKTAIHAELKQIVPDDLLNQVRNAHLNPGDKKASPLPFLLDQRKKDAENPAAALGLGGTRI